MCTSARRQTVVATKFGTLASNIGVSPAWNLFNGTLLPPRILTCLLDFWEVRAPLNYMQRFSSRVTENAVIVPLERPNGVRCSLYGTVHVNCTNVLRGKNAEFFDVNL